MMKDIKLGNLLKIKNPENYKVHLASWNDAEQPLDVFVRSRKEWKIDWNSWSKRNDFSRKRIFSLINFYHESDTWLFGGVFEVIKGEKDKEKNKYNYTVELTNQLAPMIGRLKLSWKRSTRNKAIYFEKCIEEFDVSEILKEPYRGERFPGYEDICHDFGELEAIFSRNRSGWKPALENAKGIYLIMDKSNGKKYVGSASGDVGIWSRWSDYLVNHKTRGHGNNVDLKEIINKKGIKYARENFRLSLLEYMPMKTDDKKILDREKYWKDVLLSQGKFGYNKN